jgi:serine/threonine protein kinase
MEIRIANRYSIVKKIASGAFGTVYRGYDIVTNLEVAVKLVGYLVSW